MRTGIAVGACVLFFALALAIRAPAALVDSRLQAISGGSARLADASGTVWNGRGALWLAPGYATPRFEWHLDAWPLLAGELHGWLVGEHGGEPRASFAISGGALALRDVALAVPAQALLHAAGAPEALASAGGTIGLRSDALSLRSDAIDGRIAMRWDGATLSGPRPEARVALGDVRLDAVGQGNALTGTLANAGGDVDISGSARASTDGAARVEAVIRPRAGIDAERARAIAAALAVLGRPEGADGYHVSWSAPSR